MMFWEARIKAIQKVHKFSAILRFSKNYVRSFAKHKAELDLAKSLAEDTPTKNSVTSTEGIEGRIIVWEYYHEQKQWVFFDRVTMEEIELSHGSGVSKLKILPANEELYQRGTKGTYLVDIEKRLLVSAASDGKKYVVRRKTPFISYTVLEVGVTGIGDKATSE